MVFLKENVKLLEEILFYNKISSDKIIRILLRNDILSKIKRKSSDLNREYQKNELIKNVLVGIHNEILDENNKRKTFAPGTFQGIQGKLNCIILTKNFIKNKKWSLAEVMNNLNYRILYKYKLRCSKTCFKHLYKLIKECYPNENLKPYYFKKATHIWVDKYGHKNNELIKDAIREFIEVFMNQKGQYKYKLKNLPCWINYKMFREPMLPYGVNLSYMLGICFKNSHIKAIMFAYPELNLKPYYFSNVPNKYWSGKKGLENAREVMVELMDILTNPKGSYNLSKEEILQIFKFKTYSKPLLPYRKNLRGMLQTIFNNSPSAPFKILINNQNQKIEKLK